MSLVALGLVYRYGTKTLPQNDEVWALYDSGPGIHIDWLWKTWAEHRIPLAKLIWKGVLQLTNYDFRSGNFLTVLGLSAAAGLMLWTANKIRGRTILADAFFPLAILNVGQAQVFLWWWQVNHVLAPILATVLLSVLVVRSKQLRLADVGWIGVALIVLVPCGPGGLPYVAVFATWLAVWTAANWRSFSPPKTAAVCLGFHTDPHRACLARWNRFINRTERACRLPHVETHAPFATFMRFVSTMLINVRRTCSPPFARTGVTAPQRISMMPQRFLQPSRAQTQATWALIDGKIHTDAKVRTMRKLTIWVDTTIDEFRLYPDSAPCEVRFSSIELLEPASESRDCKIRGQTKFLPD